MIVWWMSGMWHRGPLLTASFCFQMINLSSFSLRLSLSLSFTFCYNLKQGSERESWERRERGMGGEKRQEEVIRKILLLPSLHPISSPLLTRALSARRELRGDQRWAEEEFWQSQSRHRTGKFCKSIIKLKAKNDIKEWWDKRRSLFISSNCNHCSWSI